jgi:hypothetical protein
MYTDLKRAFNAADYRIMFNHIRQLVKPSMIVDTCEHLYGVSTTNCNTHYGPIPFIDINQGTL